MADIKGPIMVDEEYLMHVNGARDELRTLILTKDCAPSMLRLSFLDAGTFDAEAKTGGPNGSIRFQLDAPQNTKNAVDLCEQVKAKYPKISYADLYQLAGVVAVEVTGGPTIHFVPGRPDKDISQGQDDFKSIPSPSGDAQHLREVFFRMGLSDKDIVALTGAHTLGRATKLQGHNGPFTQQPLKFDNSFYVELMKGDTPGLVKFNSHKALIQDALFHKYVQLYAQDDKKFFQDYAVSHKKMSELGFCPPTVQS